MGRGWRTAFAMVTALGLCLPLAGNGQGQAAEAYVRLRPQTSQQLAAPGPSQCDDLANRLNGLTASKCRAVAAPQGVMSLRWDSVNVADLDAQLRSLKDQGFVEWFEFRRQDLHTQSIGLRNPAVIADPAYMATITPTPVVAGEPWFVNDDIRRLRAWNRMMEVAGQVVIAIIDSGVNFNDPVLASMRWNNPREIPGNGIDDDGNGYVDDVAGWDFVDEGSAQLFDDTTQPDNDPSDALGHGTAVAWIAGAIVGAELRDRVRLMPLRVAFGVNGSGSANPMALAEAITYAVNNGAHIINISLGGAQRYEVVAEAIRHAIHRGVAVIVAAGNSTDTALFPASEPGVVSVGATDSKQIPLPFTPFGRDIDILAPGIDMTAAMPLPRITVSGRGTSFAAPVVAGSLALLWASGIGPDAICSEARHGALLNLPETMQLRDWAAFNLHLLERLRPTGDANGWKEKLALCTSPRLTLSGLVRNP